MSLVANGFEVNLVADRFALAKTTLSAHAYAAFVATYNVDLKPGTSFSVLWRDLREHSTSTTGFVWAQEGAGSALCIGVADFKPGQAGFATISGVVSSGEKPLNITVIIKEVAAALSKNDALVAPALVRVTLLCFVTDPTSVWTCPVPEPRSIETVGGALYSPDTERHAYRELQGAYNIALTRAEHFEHMVETLYSYLTPAAHLQYLDARLTREAPRPELRVGIAEARIQTANKLRLQSSQAVDREFLTLMKALQNPAAVPTTSETPDKSF